MYAIIILRGAFMKNKQEDKLVTRKSNMIVRHAVTKFNYKQNQLMCVLLGKYINLKNNECIDTEVGIDELRQILGLNDGSENYNLIKKAVTKFGENGSVGFLTFNEKGEPVYKWMPFFKEIELTKNCCKFSWNDRMKDHLVNLKNNYTQYLASDYLKLGSVYSQNLYEQMKALENYRYNYAHELPRITVKELREIMQVGTKYPSFNTFKNMCLQRAIDEINEKTDLHISINTVKKGRTVVEVEFDIMNKSKKFNYEGCWLNYDEIDDIIKKNGKSKIHELAKIKKDNNKYYQMLRQNDETDYEIILNFIKCDADRVSKADEEPVRIIKASCLDDDMEPICEDNDNYLDEQLKQMMFELNEQGDKSYDN